MIKQLLLKDYKKRPGMAEILQMDSMKKKMKQFGYDENDHLLSQSQVNMGHQFKAGGGVGPLKKSTSHEPRLENKLSE